MVYAGLLSGGAWFEYQPWYRQPSLSFPDFPQSLQKNSEVVPRRLGHRLFLKNTFQFIIHQLFINSSMYNMKILLFRDISHRRIQPMSYTRTCQIKRSCFVALFLRHSRSHIRVDIAPCRGYICCTQRFDNLLCFRRQA
jgi:hypothetical protein